MPDQNTVLAVEAFEKIGLLSRGIDEAITAEDPFKINQLLMNRGKVIDGLKTLQLSELPEDLKTGFSEQLTKIQVQEPHIQKALQALADQCQNKLNNLQENKKAVGGYKMISEQRHYQDSQA